MIAHARLTIGVLAVLAGLLGSDLAAQDRWKWDLSLGGSTFFGDVDQTAVSMTASTTRADSLWETSGRLSFDYGETSDPRTGESAVSRRSWVGVFAVDRRPEDTWSPFAFGTGEQSYEKRIDFRYNAGLGLKYTFESNDTTRIDLSGATLAEQTFAYGDTSTAPSSDMIARLSLRFRVRHTFGSGDPSEDVTFDTRNFYGPQVDSFDHYTIGSRTSLDYPLTGALALGFLFQYDFDSQSMDRGANSNHTGKLYLNFGVTF